MTKQFPKFASHTSVLCFNCSTPTKADPAHSGYPRGQWQQQCPCCGMRTFYDLKRAA
jgi:hypothetical protein